jgi:hypothetical protein
MATGATPLGGTFKYVKTCWEIAAKIGAAASLPH